MIKDYKVKIRPSGHKALYLNAESIKSIKLENPTKEFWQRTMRYRILLHFTT